MPFIALLLLLGSISSIEPYNVDLTVPLLKSYTGNAQGTNIAFGAAVVIRKTSTTTLLLVGAPKANVSGIGVIEGGGVYQCGIDNSLTCSFRDLDATLGNLINDNRTGQLFGQVLKSSQGHLLICAPLYRYFTKDTSGESYFPIGKCVAFEESLGLSSSGSLVFPCLVSADDDADYAMCELGLDVAIDDAGEHVGFGAPYVDGGTGEFFYSTWTNVQGESVNRKGNFWRYSDSGELINLDISDQLGFSVASGLFVVSDPSTISAQFAVGAPKEEDYFGAVVVVDFAGKTATPQTKSSNKITSVQGRTIGSQFGSMFGYAVATANIDGDSQKLTELIVSAPYHGSLDRINVGRVYVFRMNGTNAMSSLGYFDGRQANGLFGLALSSLGDVDLDGFEDIAVGAPFEDGGVVYVYYGYKDGLRDDPQVIKSSSVAGLMSSFGFSLSKGTDVDSNIYPDFAVGAYRSNKAMLLRSRPVVIVQTSVKANISSLQLDAAENCVLDQETFCFDLGVCVWYEDRQGQGADSIPNLSVDYKLTLDSNRAENRLVVRDPADGNLKSTLSVKLDLTPGMANQTCVNYTVALKENIQDKSSAFVISVEASLPVLFNSAPTLAPGAPSDSLPDLYPILDRYNPSSSQTQVRIIRNCPYPPEDRCRPDLIPSFLEVPPEIIAGSRDFLVLVIKVWNQPSNVTEASFQTQLIVGFPDNFVYINHNLTDANTPLLGCASYYPVGAICDIGNPLDPNKERVFHIELQQKRDGPLIGNEGEIEISLNATSVDGDVNEEDNFIMTTIKVGAQSELQMDGFSEVLNLIPPPLPGRGPRIEITIDPSVLGNVLSGKSDNSSLSIGHRYNIRNVNETTVPRIAAEFWFPYMYSTGAGTTVITNITASYSLGTEGQCDVIASENDTLQIPVGCRGNVRCAQVKCDVNQELVTSNVLSIIIKGVATLDAITQFAFDTVIDPFAPDVSLTSYGSAEIVSSYIERSNVTADVKTNINFSIQIRACVEIWYIVVSVIGSLVVLSIIIIILYSFGFFKPKKLFRNEGGMIGKDQGPQENQKREASPSSQEEIKKKPEPQYEKAEPQYAEAKSPVRSERSSLSSAPPMKEFTSEPRRSKASLPGMKEFDEEPRRTSRGGAYPPMRQLDEEPKMRRPSSSGSGGGIPIREWEQEQRRSVGSGGRYSSVDGEPTSPKKPYSETMM